MATRIHSVKYCITYNTHNGYLHTMTHFPSLLHHTIRRYSIDFLRLTNHMLGNTDSKIDNARVTPVGMLTRHIVRLHENAISCKVSAVMPIWLSLCLHMSQHIAQVCDLGLVWIPPAVIFSVSPPLWTRWGRWKKLTKSRDIWWYIKRIFIHATSELLFSIFSCDQAALWMVQSVHLSVSPSVCPSVCLSICPSHLFDYVPIIVSSWIFQGYYQWQKWCKRPRLEVKGQRHRGHNPI